ncbi:MAG TPA: alpha-E domain-containing protein [Burkholderiaceae bacterium]|nr:alpha-E domain-containing protein [Burkholderiaceae bacterium]
MLSRTADHLFWMARYIERAENTARMLDVNVSTSLLPQSPEEADRGWRAMLGISELQHVFDAKHGLLAAHDVLDFMVRDPQNGSSIHSCLRAARENARAVRGTLTTEVWETHNDTWLQLQKRLAAKTHERDPQEFFEWVKFRSHLSRGVTIGTMLRDESFHFIRLGTFLERADNTARMLDVKFHGLLEASTRSPSSTPSQVLSQVQSQLQSQVQAQSQSQSQARSDAQPPNAVFHQPDFYYWAAVLRSVSAFEIYRKVYRDVVTPERIAALLILRSDMPRSLAASINEVCINLEQVKNDRSEETERRAGLLRAELQYARIDDILHQGLHAFLTRFLERVNDIGGRISSDFLVPLSVA